MTPAIPHQQTEETGALQEDDVSLIALENGCITSPRGFSASGVACGLKAEGMDMALVFSETAAVAAALFTCNKLRAAPIAVSENHIACQQARAILINSGNANACTGARGWQDAEMTAKAVSAALHIPINHTLIASTGVIGHFLPMEKILAGIQRAVADLQPNGGPDAARAIMTTDTRPKQMAIECRIDGKSCRIGAMAKGSGMIQPRLATMIAVFTTDCAIEPTLLREALQNSVNKSFNVLTVDGEQSTNDCVFILANHQCGNPPIRQKDENFRVFQRALDQVAVALAQELARDGEGASKLITVTVQEAATAEEADRAARSVANSLLVKTALFGRDPNWGRVISALGASGAQIQPEKIQIRFAGIVVAEKGQAIDYDRIAMQKALQEAEVEIEARLGIGQYRARVYTCDLSYDYVRINAEYHT
ncbi:MAG TPA: bifunctional glutamate N-acetyltransferase/amino-acid acetyltransferase ArgJ [bacterium]|jgi:glutamate N-acetyltransferase/amino-acid N-acetyltransferase|nr:bifunctional glutamate N-acetyltransferase/amino-acid acetyltransferase ArgJ [bacterium]HNT64897.1 bifunctional glutamate N-acetyltransferase/amino-acid acetyltransferase ArgJ [bacterium]